MRADIRVDFVRDPLRKKKLQKIFNWVSLNRVENSEAARETP